MTRKPLTPAQLAQRREAGRRGGRARAAQFTPEFQAAARAHVKHESLVASGRKGYAAAVRNHGPQFAADKLAEYRRKNPTSLERILIAWLDDLGVRYWREYAVDGCYFDFYLPAFTLLIEVDGDAFHGQTVHGEDRVSRDAWKNHAAAWAGYQLLRFSENTLTTGDALNTLLAVVEPHPTPQPAELEIGPDFAIGHPFVR